ncbi:hypothetical protein NDU88_007399 [Pleurodeles waltl]|uniref:Uncharacterized protein n=1 Tax=Pleurodeles waltl TaxID=8319 RepID=A0AAV7UQI9_PLEWA|nr:hypothetical protein NDU88_007399 [Pleurodeles waltl]
MLQGHSRGVGVFSLLLPVSRSPFSEAGAQPSRNTGAAAILVLHGHGRDALFSPQPLTTREEGALKEAVSGAERGKEAGEETFPIEEEQNGEPTSSEDTGKREPGRKIWLCLDRGLKINGAAEGDGGNATTREAECNNPPHFWRSVADSGI